MSLDTYLHGVEVVEVNSGSRVIRTAATSVIGVICTANDADGDTFPLNTPVLLTDPSAVLEKAGKTGTLKRTLNAIGSIVKTPTVVVRVEDSDDSDTLTANIIGSQENGKYTGLKALLTAQSTVFVKPKLIAVPKFDNQAVATELVTIAKKLSAFCFISDNGATTKEQAVAYSRNFTAREAMMIFGDWQSFDVDKKTYDVDYATARACAVQAWIDKNIGWHKNISNVEVNGVTGVTKPVSFDINEPSTDANFLNEKNITVCLNFNGFRYWGSRTLSSDTAFSFQQATRTAQIIKETMAAAHSWLVDQPITVTNVKFAINSLNNKFAEWKRNGYILDGKAWVNKEITADTLKNGELIIDYDYHWVPSGESLRFNQHVNDSYVMDLVNAITKL